jgi:nitrate/nitrite-specific signal transduction histidine kinase
MAGRLQESYADVENKVEVRTRERSRSVGELRALGEVSQAVNSTLDVEEVLRTIVAKAAELSTTDAGAIYVFDAASLMPLVMISSDARQIAVPPI